MKSLGLPIILVLLLGAIPGDRDHVVTLEDYFDLAYISTVAASPDGESVLFIVGRWRQELDRRNMDVWIATDGDVRQLTFSPQNESDLAWHPGGKEFFFRRPVKGKSQVWAMSVTGGEARQVSHAKGGVESYLICGGGDRIYYTSRERATVGEWGWFKKKYGKLIYGDGIWRLGRLWREDLKGPDAGKPEKIYGGEFHVGGFTVSPDETRVACIITPDPRLIRLEGWSEVRVVDLETKKAIPIPDTLWREQAASPYGWIEGVRWGPGNLVAFTVSWDGYPTEIYVAHLPPGEEIRVDRVPRPDGPEVSGGSLQWGGGGENLFFRAQVRTLGKVFRFRGMEGSVEPVPTGDGDVSAYSLSGNGSRLYMIRNLLERHQDVFVLPTADASAEPVRLTDVDPQVDRWILPETRIVTWKGWNDDEVEGVLSIPAGWDGKEPLPTIVMLHGGPGAASLSVLNYWLSAPVPLYAARGWAVFRPNYRGSIGYGDRFHSELIGHKNDRDVKDILAGVQHLIDQGIADPRRLAVNGWSNGGSLTNWLVVTAPDRFGAAASGAGVADFTFQFGLEDTPGHVVNYSEGFPWETWEILMRRSPLANADKVKTPVLFLVGEKDARVPAAHSRAFHRSLTYLGVPTELIIFPGEGHGLDRMSHRQAKIEMELHWFEKYVLEKDPSP